MGAANDWAEVVEKQDGRCCVKRGFRCLAKWDERGGRNSVFVRCGNVAPCAESFSAQARCEKRGSGKRWRALLPFSGEVGTRAFPTSPENGKPRRQFGGNGCIRGPGAALLRERGGRFLRRRDEDSNSSLLSLDICEPLA